MGQIIRCPLVGTPCMREIIVQEKTFFLAEAEKPEGDRKRRIQAINESIGDDYEIRSALDEKGINAFTCKICEMIQTCAYGIADITNNNPNVLFELGIMIALGKATLILLRKDQEIGLKLPSDLNAIEVIPFTEYIDIIDQLRAIVPKLPPPILPPSPIEDIEKMQPQIAEQLREMGADIVKEFKSSIEEAKLDTISVGEERKAMPPELSERLMRLEEKLEDLSGLGFVTDPQTALLRGNYYYNQEKYNEALANYNWVLETEPDDPTALYNRGNTYARLERYKESLADYKHSLELRRDDPDTLNNRGSTYARLERYKESLADYNHSLELRRDDPDTLNNRGSTYARLERYKESLADYNHSLELRRDNSDTLNNRGLTYSHLERYKEALADYNRSLELRPDNLDVFTNRGITYTRLERYEEALADYNRSLKLAPDDPNTLYNLACLFSLWRKTDDALAYLEKAVKRDEKYREDARTDEDFDNIRDDPRFKKLIESD